MSIPLGQAPVIKKLITLASGNKVETIYFRRPEKQVICLSTQISCNIGCIFCASPGKGKTYNLTTDEMLYQIHSMRPELNDDIPLLISFMGEGEPFANYQQTIEAMHAADNLYDCRLAVSTVGLNLLKFNKEKFNKPVKLQISIHSLNNDIRNKIMPKAPLINNILPQLDLVNKNPNINVELNFTLIENINDGKSTLEDIKYFLEDFHIKISKYNKTDKNTLIPASEANCLYFVKSLRSDYISAEYHKTDGESNMAACGQTSGIKVTNEKNNATKTKTLSQEHGDANPVRL